jgi:thiol-disulfide isomerase/thioredoxin
MKLFTRFLLLLFVLSIYSCSKHIKSDVPEFSTKQYNGDTVNLKELAKNKVTIIFFWTTFCDNCLTEISNIHDVYDKYKNNKNVTFLTIAFNTNKEIEQFNSISDTVNPYKLYFKYLKMAKFDMPVLIGSDQGYEIYSQDDGSFIPGIKDTSEVNKLYNTFDFRGLPTIIIYSAEGKLICKYSGPQSMRSDPDKYRIFLDNKIDSLLN